MQNFGIKRFATKDFNLCVTAIYSCNITYFKFVDYLPNSLKNSFNILVLINNILVTINKFCFYKILNIINLKLLFII